MTCVGRYNNFEYDFIMWNGTVVRYYHAEKQYLCSPNMTQTGTGVIHEAVRYSIVTMWTVRI
jgi:hypothetical protein